MKMSWKSAISTCIAILSIIVSSFGAVSGTSLHGVVVGVVDGETFSFESNGHILGVRICAISVPRSNPAADVARSHLTTLIKAKSVTVEYQQFDSEGRMIGVVSSGQVDVGMQMIRDGAALYNRADANDLPDQYGRLYDESEQAARNEKRGIWRTVAAPARDESTPTDNTSLEEAKTPAQIASRFNDEGYRLILEHNYRAAMPKIREALRLDPKLAAAHKNLALIFCETGRYQDALPEAEEALKLDPSSDKSNNVLGKILYALGDDAGAVRAYKEAIRLNPKYMKAHYNLGVAFLRMERYADAADSFRRAEVLDPNLPDTKLDLGLSLYYLGRRSEARELWRKVLTMGDPVMANLAEGNLSQLPK